MTAVGHAVIGSVIAAKLGNPALALPIAVASHVVADYFPHWDAGTHKEKKSKQRFFMESVIDVLLSIGITYLIIHFIFPHTNLIYAYIVVFAAQFLDWATAPYIHLKWRFPPFNWIYRFSYATNTRLDKPWGIIGQVAVLLLLLVVAKKF